MSAKTYRIGEAATLLNLKTYVLRFWEMEFPQIAPSRTEKGQRLYSEQDLAVLRRIRYLLHERGLTIEGARRVLREEEAKGSVLPDAEPDMASIAAVENESDDASDVDTDADADAPSEAASLAVPDFPAAVFSALSPDLMREVAAELAAVRTMLKP